MPKPIRRRAIRHVVYLWPNVEPDAVANEILEQVAKDERPQDIYRRAMFLGLRQMAEAGEIPERILARNNLGVRLARRLPPAFTAQVPAQPPAYQPAPQPQPFPAQAHPAAHYPVAVPAAPAPLAPRPVPAEEPVDEEAFDVDAMLGLMDGPAAA